MTDELVKQIVLNLCVVTQHVATQPEGYAGYQADRAKFLMHAVDVDVLSDLLHDVLFTSDWLREHRPLTATERQVERAAHNLAARKRGIRMRQSDIQARMAS